MLLNLLPCGGTPFNVADHSQGHAANSTFKSSNRLFSAFMFVLIRVPLVLLLIAVNAICTKNTPWSLNLDTKWAWYRIPFPNSCNSKNHEFPENANTNRNPTSEKNKKPSYIPSTLPWHPGWTVAGYIQLEGIWQPSHQCPEGEELQTHVLVG